MFKRFRCKIPMNLQIFASPDGAGSGGAGQAGGNNGGSGEGSNGGQAGTNQPTIDYGKIQKMLEGTLAAKEDTALKAYFKQQGLSEDEMKQAISAFKTQKAQNTPDVSAMQAQMASYQKQAQDEAVKNAAILQAVSLGIDAKTIPYILKMADFSSAVDQDGKISEESLKNALNKVLEDVPALKPQPASQSGFLQVGASGNGSQGTNNDEALKKAFGL